MSDFDTLAASTELSRPIELYVFSIGTSTFRYTSSGATVTLASIDYDPETISRSTIEQSGELSSAVIQVKMPASNAFVALYAAVPPAERATCTVIQIEPEETPTPVQQVIFKGFVQPLRFEDNGISAILSVRSIESSLERKLPRFTYQASCQNALGDERCGASMAAHTYVGTATNLNGTVLTVAGAAATGFDFKGGIVRPLALADPRMIIDQNGDDLTLLLPFASSIVGQQVEVEEGCDHLLDGDCGAKYNRAPEYNGFFFVPKRDIFRNGLR